ncbi:hypothetical protein AB672_02515 [Xylella taiwanensis]|nr:hypothetical protein AB672_02515 [Xylella taiwanensis]
MAIGGDAGRDCDARSQLASGNQLIPPERCPAIEWLTARTVSCEALRPDVDWECLRGTVVAAQAEPNPDIFSLTEAPPSQEVA